MKLTKKCKTTSKTDKMCENDKQNSQNVLTNHTKHELLPTFDTEYRTFFSKTYKPFTILHKTPRFIVISCKMSSKSVVLLTFLTCTA